MKIKKMKEINLKFKTEAEYTGFKVLLDTGFIELTKFYDGKKNYKNSLGVRKVYAAVWQQLEEQKNVAG